jgi:hypothetical protein
VGNQLRAQATRCRKPLNCPISPLYVKVVYFRVGRSTTQPPEINAICRVALLDDGSFHPRCTPPIRFIPKLRTPALIIVGLSRHPKRSQEGLPVAVIVRPCLEKSDENLVSAGGSLKA